MKKSFKKFLSYILADNENLTLEDRLLISSVAAAALITFIGSVICIIIPLQFSLIITGFLLSLLSLVIYYFIRVRRRIRPFKLLFIIFCYLSVIAMWIFDGGIDGQSNETELVALFLILIIVPKKHRLTILLLFLVITVFIYLIQLYRPQYIIEPPSEGARWLDGLTTTIYTSVFVYLIIQVILKQYNAEKSKAEEGEKKQIELNADKDRFISVLGHDLRSPFTALLTLTESLKENIREYDINEIEEQVELLYKSSVGTYNLLEDLLLWATAQNNRIPFKPQPVSPFYACRNIIDILQPNATLKNIEINCKIEEDLNINGDPDMIKTVLRNLISNAIKFTPYGGTVNVRSELSGSKVRISVSDNGVGVKPENLKKLFDISTIYTTKGTEEEEGTGLGLLICRKFIEKHGEEIWVESEYGKGSKFHFTLPCIVNHNNSKDIKKVAGIDTETIKNMKLKVLIVDDDNISRM